MSVDTHGTRFLEGRGRSVSVPLFPITVDRYHRMIQEGILATEHPVELSGRVIVEKGSEIPWRFSVAMYHDMIEHGILTADDPVELVDGLLVKKMAKNPPHSVTTQRLRKAIEKRLPAKWSLRVQEPITLEGGEPEPDLAVVEGEDSKYSSRHPGSVDIAHLTEVSDSSLATDRGLKKQSYADAKIPVYWIINLVDTKVEVYTEPGMTPDGPDYLKREDFGIGQDVAFEVGGKRIVIPVAEFLSAK
ncbi:MAG: Uma2 family endonuclease [Gemmataceae bacterium]